MRGLVDTARDHDFQHATLTTSDWNSRERTLTLSIHVPLLGWYWKQKINHLKKRLGFKKPGNVMRHVVVTLQDAKLHGEGACDALPPRRCTLPLEIDNLHVSEIKSPNLLTIEVEDVECEIEYSSAYVTVTEIDDAHFFSTKNALIRIR